MKPGIKIGSIIRIINLFDNNGKDKETATYAGRVGIVLSIDSLGQLHGTWGSLAIIPEIDEFEILVSAKWSKCHISTIF